MSRIADAGPDEIGQVWCTIPPRTFYRSRSLEVDVGSIEYHLAELEIASSSDDSRRILPDVLDSDRAILDVGCGIGQSFIALNCTDRRCVGVDVDAEAINYGIEHYGQRIHYIRCDAQHIPLPSKSFDLAFSRVSLPYTNIPKVLKEMSRLLKDEGRVWVTLHDKSMAHGYLKSALATKNIRRLIHTLYLITNGYLLQYFGFVVPFLNGRYESWQSAEAMRKVLARYGFEASSRQVGRHTIVEGRLDRKKLADGERD